MSASQQHEILRSTLMKGNAISNSHMWQKQRQINALSLSVGRIVAPLLCFCVYKCCFLISHFGLFWQVFGGKIASFFPGNGKKKNRTSFIIQKRCASKGAQQIRKGNPRFIFHPGFSEHIVRQVFTFKHIRHQRKKKMISRKLGFLMKEYKEYYKQNRFIFRTSISLIIYVL